MTEEDEVDGKLSEGIKQLPLTRAVIELNRVKIEAEISKGADMFKKNNSGDTVFHSLVKYAAMYREKIPQLRDMFEELIKHLRKTKMESEDGWLKTPLHERNQKGYTVLQLSVRYELHELTLYIVNLDGIYCQNLSKDILISTKTHDITEIDSVANYKKHIADQDDCCQCFKKIAPSSEEEEDVPIPTSDKTNLECFTPSISEMIFRMDMGSTMRTVLAESEPFRTITNIKWVFYRWPFMIMSAIFVIYLSTLTIFSIARRDLYFHHNTVKTLSKVDDELSGHVALVVIFLLCSLIGLAPIVMLIMTRHCMKGITFSYGFHNIDTILLYTFFHLFVFCDSIAILRNIGYEGYFLNLAIPCGWAFATLISRAFRRFAYFTALIRKLIIGDLLSFMLIMVFLFLAFSASLHDLMKYNINGSTNQATNDENFYTPWGSAYALFVVYLGMREVENLEDARIVFLAYFLYIIFIILSHILLLNALIAQMSNTCSRIYDSRKAIALNQKLSIMILLEEVFIMHVYIRQVGEKRKEAKHPFFKNRRYLPLAFEKGVKQRPTTKIERKIMEIQDMIEEVIGKIN